MTAHSQITPLPHAVNSAANNLVKQMVDLIISTGAHGANLERLVWAHVMRWGRAVLAGVLGEMCRRVSAREAASEQVQYRMDQDYWISSATTFGTIAVPLHAYRSGGTTKCPARAEVFPLHPKCRSSELLLEFETRLGAFLPFRQASEALTFFTHDAVRTEDTTISRHLGVIGAHVGLEWTCRPPEEVRDILQNRATRDRASGRPLVYASTDAHALRRYVDDTWRAEHKMLNGVRFWCIDRRTQQTIHLGGEYTWGDCREVARVVAEMVPRLVPAALSPQVVFIADGMPWIREHVHPMLPKDTCFILDFYHLAQRLERYGAARFGPESAQGRAWVRGHVTELTGKRPYRRSVLSKRKGHKKSKHRAQPFRTVRATSHTHGVGDALLWRLIEEEPASDALDDLVTYVSANSDRIGYAEYRRRGMQIGSGAMESLHRVASQMRLKLAGARWTAEQATAVLKFRLMLLAGRWGAFWSRTDLTHVIRQAFNLPIEA